MTERASLGQDATLQTRHRELPVLALPVEHNHRERAIGGELYLDFLCGVVFEPGQVGQEHFDPFVSRFEVGVLGYRAELEHLFARCRTNGCSH